MIFFSTSGASSCEFSCVGSVSLCKFSWHSDLFCGGIQVFPVLATTDPSLATLGVPALFLGCLPSIYWGWVLHWVAVTAYTSPLCTLPSAA